MSGTLLIDRKEVELRRDGARLLLYEAGRRRGSVPISHLERVVIQNRAGLDSSVLLALAEHGVGLVVLNPRKPAAAAWLPGRSHNDAARRLAQYRLSLDEAWRSAWSAKLVARKIRAQRRLLAAALEERPDLRRVLTRSVGALEARLAGLQGAEVERDTVRGVEGAAAAAYFRGFTALFAPALGFQSRNRRPPRDPVNACLSLGYTLLHADAVLAIHAAGLDPLLGFYHDTVFGRESLASDLIEPLRPSVDGWVRGLFREQVLDADDFTRRGEACLLGKAGRRAFYARWAEFAPLMRRALRRSARLLAGPGNGGEEAGDAS